MMNVYFVETNAYNEVVIINGNKWVAIEKEFVDELYGETPVEILRNEFDEREKDEMWDVDFDSCECHGTFDGDEDDFIRELSDNGQFELIGTYENKED
jgi:hypothetical protein